MEKIKSFAKKHPIWTGVIGIFLLFILIGIFSGRDNSSTTNIQSNQNFQDAINIISPKLTGLPDLDINSNDLQVIKNPIGEGIFVYVPQTEFYGVERFFLWIVIDNNAYAINGATKGLTPLLNFPRDANEEVWGKTGLDKYDASESVGIVFREEIPSKNSQEIIQTNNQQDTPSEETEFSKFITDAKGDCESTPCKEGIDIISASLNQKNGFATVIIELSGNVPSASELKEIKDEEYGLLWPEIYQYVIYVKVNGAWVDVLFGDVRADTKKAEGGCGVSYLVKKNIGTCEDSQVSFLIEKNKVTISGPLKPEITAFRIKTLYEASVDDDSVTDMAESN